MLSAAAKKQHTTHEKGDEEKIVRQQSVQNRGGEERRQVKAIRKPILHRTQSSGSESSKLKALTRLVKRAAAAVAVPGAKQIVCNWTVAVVLSSTLLSQLG